MARDRDESPAPASDEGDGPAEGTVRAKHSTARNPRPTDHAAQDAFVEETSRDSFPASDAPAW